MISARLPWYAMVVVLVLLVGYGLAVAGLVACSPPPLTGDEWWAWKQWLLEAAGVTLGGDAQCFLPTVTGGTALAAGTLTWLGALAAVLLAILWELAGHRLRRALRRRHGGHAILFGEPGEIEAFAKSLTTRPTAFVARSRQTALAIARRHPFADVTVLADRRSAPALVASLGTDRAAFTAAACANDLANSEFAEAVLQAGGSGETLVRLEHGSVRALRGDVLRRVAEGANRHLTVISLRQIQARQALQLAMPGRYVDDGATRTHIAICGAGPMVQEIAFLTARQGYGLERAAPLLSVMRTGRSDFGAGALERLVAAEAIDVQPVVIDGEDASRIDRGFSTIALNRVPLAAVHCCEEDEGGALALALRIERVFVDLDLPVPPIIVHGAAGEQPGDTGMVRAVGTPTLADARDKANLLDQRAKAFHAAYLDGQRQARGAEFGGLPAEAEWPRLAEQYREDNRASADHLDYKLARAGAVAVSRTTARVGFAPEETDLLAAVEHARWMARRSVGGWRLGEARDDAALLHPDMKPFAELDADAQRKDRTQVAVLAEQVQRAGERLARLRPCAILSAGPAARALALVKDLAASHPGDEPLVAIDAESEDGLAVAETALANGLLIEAVITGASEQALGDPKLVMRAATILRRAWRIRVVRGRPAMEALAANEKVLVDAEGRLHETALA